MDAASTGVVQQEPGLGLVEPSNVHCVQWNSHGLHPCLEGEALLAQDVVGQQEFMVQHPKTVGFVHTVAIC